MSVKYEAQVRAQQIELRQNNYIDAINRYIVDRHEQLKRDVRKSMKTLNSLENIISIYKINKELLTETFEKHIGYDGEIGKDETNIITILRNNIFNPEYEEYVYISIKEMIENYDSLTRGIDFSKYNTTKEKFRGDLENIMLPRFESMYTRGNKTKILKIILDPLVDKYLPKEIWDALDNRIKDKINRNTFNTVYYMVKREHKKRKNDVLDTINSIISNSELTDYVQDKRTIIDKFIPDFDVIKKKYGTNYKGSILEEFEKEISTIELRWKRMNDKIKEITYPAFYRSKKKDLINTMFREWLNRYDVDEIKTILADIFQFKAKTDDPVVEFSRLILPTNPSIVESRLRVAVAESSDSTKPTALKIEDLLK